MALKLPPAYPGKTRPHIVRNAAHGTRKTYDRRFTRLTERLLKKGLRADAMKNRRLIALKVKEQMPTSRPTAL